MEAIGKRITVAIVRHENEERAVAKVIGDIRNLLPDAEIVVVDSSSIILRKSRNRWERG